MQCKSWIYAGQLLSLPGWGSSIPALWPRCRTGGHQWQVCGLSGRAAAAGPPACANSIAQRTELNMHGHTCLPPSKYWGSAPSLNVLVFCCPKHENSTLVRFGTGLAYQESCSIMMT